VIEIQTSRPGSEPRTQQFTTPRIRLGRNADNDVVLDSQACSRYHAEVVREKGVYKIVDLGSANGILHAGERVSELPISNGLSVELSDFTVTFSLEESATDKTMIFGGRTDRTLVLPAPAPPVLAPAAPPRELFLHYFAGRMPRHLRIVSGAEYVIGRAPDADLVLDDKEASLRHARVFSKDARFFISDMGSSNGTAVNRERVEETPIEVGDEIQIGRSTIGVAAEKAESDEAAILAQTRIGMSPFAPKEPAAPAPSPAPAHDPAPPAHTAPAAHSHPRPAAPAAPRASPAPPWKRALPWILLAAGVALAAGAAGIFLLITLTRQAGGPSPTPATSGTAGVRVQVAPVVMKEMVFPITASGSIKPKEAATVSSEVPARVLEVPVHEGQGVARGAVLARLNDRDLRLQIEEAQSAITREQVTLAKDQYDRNQRLFQQGAVTRLVLDQTKNQYLTLDSAYQSAQAKIRQLREQMSKTQILSPISGVVAKKFVSPGELLAPGAPVAIVENTEEVLVDVEVSDRDVVKVRAGQEVEASTDAFPGRTFHGQVERVGSTANPVTRSFNVQAKIANHEQELRSGMIASLRVVLTKKKALLAPVEAVSGEGDAAKVFVVRQGVARRLPVRLGDRLDREVEVLSGLSEGDEVVIYGGDQLTDGQRCQGYRKP
jgi:membrane fusion protein (multidrug efflux system)